MFVTRARHGLRDIVSFVGPQLIAAAAHWSLFYRSSRRHSTVINSAFFCTGKKGVHDKFL